MKIGISTATYFGKLLTEQTFGYIKGAGVDECEVFMNTFSEYTPEFGDLLKQEVSKSGLDVYSVHASNLNFEPNLNNPTKRARDDAEVFYRMVLENGKKLNAKSYTYHGGTRLKRREYIFDFEQLGARMQELAEIAKGYGIQFSYETVHWAYYSYPEFIASLTPYAPDVKCTLDIKQCMQAGRDFSEFIPFMKGVLNNVHLTDYDANGLILRPGKGIVDYFTLFSMLNDIGYDGPLMVELYCANYDNFEQIGESVEYLKNVLSKVE